MPIENKMIKKEAFDKMRVLLNKEVSYQNIISLFPSGTKIDLKTWLV